MHANHASALKEQLPLPSPPLRGCHIGTIAESKTNQEKKGSDHYFTARWEEHVEGDGY